MRYAKGICWIGDCRIPFVDEGDIPNDMDKTHLDGRNFYTQVYNGFMYNQNTQGRFTPNLLVCDDMLNDGNIYKSGDGSGNMELININDAHHFSYENPNRKITKMKGVQYNDKGTNSRYYDLDKWFDKIIDNL
jgi:hypothetical protein